MNRRAFLQSLLAAGAIAGATTALIAEPSTRFIFDLAANKKAYNPWDEWRWVNPTGYDPFRREGYFWARASIAVAPSVVLF